MSKPLEINSQRLWGHLHEMAEIGATPKGGVCRLALSEEDKRGRDLFASWCSDLGLHLEVDSLGNMFARRKGKNPNAPAVLMSSHLDSQPTGGKYDGVLGVLAGLEVMEILNEQGIETDVSVDIASWTNEEGARFAPAMLASGAYAGVFTEDFAQSRLDKNGVSFEEALTSIGYKGDVSLGRRKYKACFELHIEQGPVLENNGLPIGIVTGVQGIRWYDLVIKGRETHAGPCPMNLRVDPVLQMLPLLTEIFELANTFGPHARVTMGSWEMLPGVRNTVPGEARISIDLRHPGTQSLEAMDRKLKDLVVKHNQVAEAKAGLTEIWYAPPVHFDADCIQAVREAVKTFSYPSMEVVSGAGHDSVYLASVHPATMIFIPCKDGLSHNELESVTESDVRMGANVLLHSVLQMAGVASQSKDLL